MDQLSTTIAEAPAPEYSTQLDEGRPTDAAQTKEMEEGDNAEAKEPKPESRLDAIKRAAADLEKEAPAKEVKEDKPADEPKAEKADAEPAKAEKVETDEQKAEAETKRVEREERAKRPVIEPHPKMLPRAKELWHNTPHEVRSEMNRIMTEAENETQQARASVQEFEAVKPFAEMAKRSGTTLDQALSRYTQMEQTLRQDPTAGMRSLLNNMQMTPQQAIGHIAAAFNVTPERLAQHMQSDPNAYTALAPRPQQQPQQQQRQPDPEVAQLKQEVAQMRNEQVVSHTMNNLIVPFAESHPRFEELRPLIAQFWESAIVPRNLSEWDRLEACYDAAARFSPSAKRETERSPEPANEQASDSRAGNDFGGTKSVRGAPASGVDTTNRRKGKMSRTEAIAAAAAELGL